MSLLIHVNIIYTTIVWSINYLIIIQPNYKPNYKGLIISNNDKILYS